MGRRRIETKDFVNDVRSGTSHSDIMKKYGLSQRVLDDVFSRLVKSGQLHPSDLMRDINKSFESTLVVATTCSRCGALLWADSGECSNCLAERISGSILDNDTTDSEDPVKPADTSEDQLSMVSDVASIAAPTDISIRGDEDFQIDEVIEPEPEVVIDDESAQEEHVVAERRESKLKRWVTIAAMIFLSVAVPLAILVYTGTLELPEMLRATPPPGPRPQLQVATKDAPTVHPTGKRSEPTRSASPQKKASDNGLPVAAAKTADDPQKKSEQQPEERIAAIPPSPTRQTTAVSDSSRPNERSVEPKHSQQAGSAGETNAVPVPVEPDRTAALVPPLEPLEAVPARGVDLNSALGEAVREGRVDRAMALLRQGADANAVDAEGSPLLVVAVKLGHESLVDLLLEKGADPNRHDKNDVTALAEACEAENGRILESLLRYDQQKGATDLLAASEKGKTKLVELMLDRGANINARNSEGGTPLMIAASKGQLELVEVLLTRGADATAEDNKGFTALAWAYSPTAMNVTPFRVQREIIRLLKHHEARKVATPSGRE